MHPLRRFTIGRRTLLRGVAGGALVSLALPPLEAMLDAHGTAWADGEGLPLRFVTFFWGNGVMLDRWEPAEVGEGWQPSPQLAPLLPVRDYVNVCTGLQNRCEDAITHHEGMTVFSGHTFVRRDDLPGFASDYGGPTIDQVIADRITRRVITPVRSVQIQISKFLSPADNGTTAEVLSVRGEPGNLTPLPPQPNPVQVWNNLFGAFVPQADDRALRRSVLDFVKEDADRLRGRLGALDNQRIDAHLQAIYELEQKISAFAPTCDLAAAPSHTNAEPNGQEQLVMTNRIMAELLARAMLCDITRVASYMFLGLAGEAVLSEAGATSTHHVLSHQGGEPYHDGIVFIMERLSDLLQTLRDTEDIDGTNLLDSTIVLASSDCSIGWTHSVRRHPILLAGRGRGWLRHPGTHYQAVAADDPNAPNAPTAGNTSDVLLTCLRAFDPAAASIGSSEAGSDTPLTAIMA